jgi:hypothetical protein
MSISIQGPVSFSLLRDDSFTITLTYHGTRAAGASSKPIIFHQEFGSDILEGYGFVFKHHTPQGIEYLERA